MHTNLILSAQLNQDDQKYFDTVHSLQTPLDKAVREITVRQKNIQLVESVMEYLQDDIPSHFSATKPIFYLSRHIPTPNEETLHFIDTCKNYDSSTPIVIGQDTEDIFVGNNVLKRNLGKLPVNVGNNRHNEPIYKHINIIDFNKSHGKKLASLNTNHGKSLVSFHTDLLLEVEPHNFTIADESDWINRNHRGNLLEHYKKMLALFIVHGIMFELYENEDQNFVKEILIPANDYVTNKFGVQPLITYLVDPSIEFNKNWNAYPTKIYPHIKRMVECK